MIPCPPAPPLPCPHCQCPHHHSSPLPAPPPHFPRNHHRRQCLRCPRRRSRLILRYLQNLQLTPRGGRDTKVSQKMPDEREVFEILERDLW